jgi:hypothetical protein
LNFGVALARLIKDFFAMSQYLSLTSSSWLRTAVHEWLPSSAQWLHQRHA